MCGIKLRHDLSMSKFVTIQYIQCVSFDLSLVITQAYDTNIQSETDLFREVGGSKFILTSFERQKINLFALSISIGIVCL